MADRSVAVAQPRRIIAQPFAPAQADQDIAERRLIHVEFGDVVSCKLIQPVSQQIELRLVRPKNRPVPTDPKKTDGRRVQKIPQRVLAAAQGFHFSPKNGILLNVCNRECPGHVALSQHVTDQ